MTLADFLVVSVEVVVDLLSIWQVSCTLAALFSLWFPSLGSRSGFPLLPMNPFLMRSNNWEIKMQLVWWASPLESLGRWCGKAFIHIRHSFLGGYRQFYIASHMNSPLVRTIRQERSTIHPIFLHCGLTLPYSFVTHTYDRLCILPYLSYKQSLDRGTRSLRMFAYGYAV